MVRYPQVTSSYTNPEIICHRDAEPGAATAGVFAEGTMQLQWTGRRKATIGPFIHLSDELQRRTDCSMVDKTTLEFFNTKEAGLVDDSQNPGQ